MKRFFIIMALMATFTQGANAQISSLPPYGISASDFVVTSKHSSRALVKSASGEQITQTDYYSNINLIPSTADVTIDNFGTVTNPPHFPPGVYTTYKFQWGNRTPSKYSLTNSFWDVSGASDAEGTQLITWRSLVQDNQRFIVQATGDDDGSVYLLALHSGKALQIAGNSTVSLNTGAKVEQRSLYNTSNQKFFIQKRTSNGTNLSSFKVIQNTGLKNSLQVTPNPAGSIITISLAAAEMRSYSIFDLSGSLKLNATLSGNKATIDISTLQGGLYVIAVRDAQGQEYSYKFIKQ